MTGQNRFINLRNSLAALYADEASLRRLLHDAGLDVARVMLTSSALNNWHAILIEAEKSNRLTTLMELALAEYPENPALQAAVAAYGNATPALNMGERSASVPPVPAARCKRLVSASGSMT
jgi:hypothetical protein